MRHAIRSTKTLLVFFITAAVLAGGNGVVRSQSNTDSTAARAGIGIFIKVGERTVRAKGTEMLKAGDRYQIRVKPEGNLYIYIIHSDRKIATLLKAVEPGSSKADLILPSRREYYGLAADSSVETVTVICSVEKLEQLSPFLDSRLPNDKWAPLELELLARGKLDMDAVSVKPFPMAGVVRERSGEKPHKSVEDPDVLQDNSPTDELPIFSGNSLVVKRYVFTIKK